MSNSEDIVDAIEGLAAAFDKPLTADAIDLYVGALMDLSREELHHGFDRAIKELKFWPRASELRELCTGLAASMTDKLRSDAAWQWVHWYIEKFGVPAKDRWLIQGKTFNGRSPEIAIRGSMSKPAFATTAPFYEIEVIAVPTIPELVLQTLDAMSGGVEMGLTRLRDAIQVYGRTEGNTSKDSAFIRKDWEEYCTRAIAAARIPAASDINPAMQLAGDVAPEFPVPQPKGIAVRIAPSFEGYAFRRLTLDDATALKDAGSLPRHLYEDVLQRHLADKAEQKSLNIPKEFSAVYLERFRPLEERNGPEPCRMGSFTIESGDGSRVIIDSLQMGIGEMQLVKGQVVRFTATRKDLRYEAYQRFYFDLQEMSVRQIASQHSNTSTTVKEES